MRERSELEDEYSVKSGVLTTWKQLTEHPGWALYSKILEEQRRIRAETNFATPLKSFGDVLPQEFQKGEGMGLALAKSIPATMIEGLQLDLEKLRVFLEQESENEVGTTVADARSRVDDDDFSGE